MSSVCAFSVNAYPGARLVGILRIPKIPDADLYVHPQEMDTCYDEKSGGGTSDTRMDRRTNQRTGLRG